MLQGFFESFVDFFTRYNYVLRSVYIKKDYWLKVALKLYQISIAACGCYEYYLGVA